MSTVTWLILLTGMCMLAASGAGGRFPDPAIDEPRAPRTTLKKAVFAGGCFWCTEAVFRLVHGVVKVVSGYSGGTRETANYEAVSTGKTGHAEAIEITYDASKITYGALLRIFFEIAHDPTQLNRQGPDVGSQYRSAIFAITPEQKDIAVAYIQQLDAAQVFPRKIVTEVNAFQAFYEAESYHQNYCSRNPQNPYIRYNALPKIEKLKKARPEAVKK